MATRPIDGQTKSETLTPLAFPSSRIWNLLQNFEQTKIGGRRGLKVYPLDRCAPILHISNLLSPSSEVIISEFRPEEVYALESRVRLFK